MSSPRRLRYEAQDASLRLSARPQHHLSDTCGWFVYARKERKDWPARSGPIETREIRAANDYIRTRGRTPLFREIYVEERSSGARLGGQIIHDDESLRVTTSFFPLSICKGDLTAYKMLL